MERTLKALANRRRLAILRFIREEKEANVGEVAEEIRLSFKATSRHLSILSSADLLEREQRSSQVFYQLPKSLPIAARHILTLL